MTKEAELAKEKVLAVYNTARMWVIGDGSESVNPRYYVEYSHANGYMFLSRYHLTEEDAWIYAWNFVQRLMLQKLQS
jgi:hypothetical protein